MLDNICKETLIGKTTKSAVQKQLTPASGTVQCKSANIAHIRGSTSSNDNCMVKWCAYFIDPLISPPPSACRCFNKSPFCNMPLVDKWSSWVSICIFIFMYACMYIISLSHDEFSNNENRTIPLADRCLSFFWRSFSCYYDYVPPDAIKPNS